MRMKKTLLVLLLLSATGIAEADIQKNIAKCAAEGSDAERLICYDEIAKSLKIDKPTVTPKETVGEWKSFEKKSPIDDSINMTLYLEANKEIEGQLSIRNFLPSLIIKCAENKTNVYINWGRYLGLNNTRVLARIDKNKAQTKRWDLSTDNKATFARKAIGFSKSLFDHEKLLVQLTPYGGSPVMTTFNIAGLKESIKPLRKACNW